MTEIKRKRSSNFTEEEKLRFVRLLQQKGNVIISKVTSHDSNTNRLKEDAWMKICEDLNSSGSELRTKETLKKLWQKLKSDAKTYKSAALHQVRGTGGGPSRKIDDPVLELVGDITGRGNSGIQGVADCDSDLSTIIETENTELVQTEVQIDSTFMFENRIPTIIHIQDELSTNEAQDTCPTSPVFENITNYRSSNTSSFLKRRRPQLSENKNERAGPTEESGNISNSIASERLRSEKAKTELIKLKMEQETEFHKMRIENAKKIFELKEKVLNEILIKLQGSRELSSDMLKIIMEQMKE